VEKPDFFVYREAVVCIDETPQSIVSQRLLVNLAHNELGLQAVDIARRLRINQSIGSRSAW
jgi:hypothetical protein